MLTGIFDTETSGLPPKGSSPHDDDFPFVVELAVLLVDDAWREVSCFSSIVAPPAGRVISEGAIATHGISTELALEVGVSQAFAVAVFDRLMRRAARIAAHNLSFDERILEAAWIKHATPTAGSWQAVHGGRPRVCTADLATPVVKIPPTEKMMRYPGLAKGFKRPKLSECAAAFFQESHADAHGALADTHMCARVLRHIEGLPT